MQCASLSVAQVSPKVLQNAQGTRSGWHCRCLGFLEPALSHPGLLFIVQLFHSSVDELCFQSCLGTEGTSARNSSGQGRRGSGCLSTAPSLGQSLVEEAPGCICELGLSVRVSCFSRRSEGIAFPCQMSRVPAWLLRAAEAAGVEFGTVRDAVWKSCSSARYQWD